MKTLISSLLVGALLVLCAPGTSAQRVVGTHYSSYSYSRPTYVSSRVWVEGPCQRVWVEPAFEWRFGPCGFRYVCVRAGYWNTVQLPGHYENRCVQVWRPGHWAERGC